MLLPVWGLGSIIQLEILLLGLIKWRFYFILFSLVKKVIFFWLKSWVIWDFVELSKIIYCHMNLEEEKSMAFFISVCQVHQRIGLDYLLGCCSIGIIFIFFLIYESLWFILLNYCVHSCQSFSYSLFWNLFYAVAFSTCFELVIIPELKLGDIHCFVILSSDEEKKNVMKMKFCIY